jgi:hypothetical protein
MRTLLTLTCLSLVVAAAGPVAAQQRAPLTARPAGGPAAPSDQERFDAVLASAVKFLASQPAYAVNVHSAWKTSQGAEGQNAYWLTVQQPGKFRVEVQSGVGHAPEVYCVCDGTYETTLLTTRNLYSRLPAASSGVQRNKLLAMSLAGSGLDVLLSPNVVGAVNSQIADVKYLGTTPIRNIQAHGFQMNWAGQTVKVYFAAQGNPLLLQFSRKTEVATGENSTFELEAVASFNWKLNPQVTAETFALAIPKDAAKVHDIYNSLAGEETRVVGAPLPNVEVVTLEGERQPIAAVPGRPATVMIFWATWCAPSVQEMPAVTEFVQGLHAKGLGIYAVNVAEPMGEVRRFATKHGLEKAVVIDSTGELACQLQLDDLPAAVIVDGQGKVISVVQGTVEEVKTGLSKELAALLPAAANVGNAQNKAPAAAPNRK